MKKVGRPMWGKVEINTLGSLCCRCLAFTWDLCAAVALTPRFSFTWLLWTLRFLLFLMFRLPLLFGFCSGSSDHIVDASCAPFCFFDCYLGGCTESYFLLPFIVAVGGLFWQIKRLLIGELSDVLGMISNRIWQQIYAFISPNSWLFLDCICGCLGI